MNNDLETILDLCLDQIENGESDIDSCLVRYPEHAAQPSEQEFLQKVLLNEELWEKLISSE